MFAERTAAALAQLERSQQSGGYLTTVVFADGSFWEHTRQAGSGVYFATPPHLLAIGWEDERSQSFPCPDYRSALGSELYASYQAILTFVETSYPHEHPDRARQFLPDNYEEPVRRLLIKQDCQMAIRMILYCLSQQRQEQHKQQQQLKEIKFIHSQLYNMRIRIEECKSRLNHARKQDEEQQLYHEKLARAMHMHVLTKQYEHGPASASVISEIRSLSSEIQALQHKLATQFPRDMSTGLSCASLHDLFATQSPDTVIDSSHGKFKIHMRDIQEHLPLLENILSLIHLNLFDVRWEYVKSHQMIPAAPKQTDESDDSDVSVESDEAVRTFNHADKFGNDQADKLAKDGSRMCSPIE
jgi:hypothetical protein